MAIGPKSKLIEKATGQAPTPPTPPVATPKGQALINTIKPSAGYAEFLGATGLATPASPTQGLSSKGKYGGYYTASDLDTAIRGEATLRNEAANAWAQSLRDLAAKTMGTTKMVNGTVRADDIGQLGQLAGQTFGGTPKAGTPAKALFGGYDTGAPMSTEADEEAYDVLAREAFRQTQQAGQTAGMVEETPMSAYAQAIATQKYGMNPALAAGMYGTEYDVEAYNQMLDQQTMATYGVPYAEFEKQEAEAESALSEQLAREKMIRDEETRLATAEATKQLGVDAARLASQAGLTPMQVYEALGQYDIAEPAAEILKNINEGDYETARTEAEKYLYNPGTEVVGRILNAYINQILALEGKTTRGLQAQADLSAVGGIIQ